MDHFQLKNGELYCEDVPLADIGAEVGRSMLMDTRSPDLYSLR